MNSSSSSVLHHTSSHENNHNTYSYKVGEAMQSSSNQRKRSVQSDSALLPSNVFFQRTPSPALEYLRTDRTARRRGSKVRAPVSQHVILYRSAVWVSAVHRCNLHEREPSRGEARREPKQIHNSHNKDEERGLTMPRGTYLEIEKDVFLF